MWYLKWGVWSCRRCVWPRNFCTDVIYWLLSVISCCCALALDPGLPACLMLSRSRGWTGCSERSLRGSAGTPVCCMHQSLVLHALHAGGLTRQTYTQDNHAIGVMNSTADDRYFDGSTRRTMCCLSGQTQQVKLCTRSMPGLCRASPLRMTGKAPLQSACGRSQHSRSTASHTLMGRCR